MRLCSTADVLEAVPYLLGFEPAESLVALSVRGRRLGLTLRVDVPGEDDLPLVAAQVVASLRADGADAAVLVGYAGPDGVAIDVLVAAVRDGLARARIAVPEALRVQDRRWTSYACRQPECCPADGTPLRDRLRSPGAVGPAAVVAGHRVLGDRDDLVRTLDPVRGALAGSMALALERELDRYGDPRAGEDGSRAHRTVECVRAVLTRDRSDCVGTEPDGAPPPVEVAVDEAAAIIVGVLDVAARDVLLDGWDETTGRPARGRTGRIPATGAHTLDPALRPGADRLWSELVRRAVHPGLVAPVATLLAWNRYIHHGGGALVTIAIERALDDVPGYVMAEGLLSLLLQGVSPERFRAMAADTARGSRQDRARPCA